MTNEFPCNLCGGPMTVTPDSTGVMVKCFNPCLDTCHENVFGHGKTAKEAWEISKLKYPKLSNNEKPTITVKKQ